MSDTAAITVDRSPEEVERLWQSPHYRTSATDGFNGEPTFAAAPGDRGTEIRIVAKGTKERAKAMDELRRFKQLVETGVISRSEGVPEGETAERKLKQRPAQPLSDDELQKAGVV